MMVMMLAESILIIYGPPDFTRMEFDIFWVKPNVPVSVVPQRIYPVNGIIAK